MKNYTYLLLLLSLSIAFSASRTFAQEKPQFVLPLDCTLNKDCWVINYVDTDSHEKSARDFTCGGKTDEGHKGTDFGLRSRIEMEQGVNVLAARDGKILRLRDGEDDTQKTQEEYKSIRDKNKDCGNGVIIDHGNGLQTYYCQLKQNSISVAIGDEVKKGDVIAQVGQSGFAEFPHLHFTVIWEGGQVDPFTGHLKDDGCGRLVDNMWEPDIPYDPYTVYDGGFENQVPDFNEIKKGRIHPTTLSVSGDALVYWASFYNAIKDDKITLVIRDPDGQVFASRTQIIEESRNPASYYYTGRKLKDRIIKSGTYTGSITYERKGHAPKTYTHKINVN